MGDVSEADKSFLRQYEVTIQNFSMIKNTVEIYKSAVFDAGCYKWKLVVHPNGNKRKKVKEHLSFYLALAERVEFGWEVEVEFCLYLRKKCDQFQDFGTERRRFHPLKLEDGFDEFIDFDKLNGFLERDCCILGANIVSASPAKTEGKAECLSMLLEPAVVTYTWKIDKFSTKLNQECLSSEAFRCGNIEWKMKVYPESKEREMSVYLELANPASFGYRYRIYAEVILRIKDESKGREAIVTDKFWFSGTSPEQWIRVDKYDGLRKWNMSMGKSDVVVVHSTLKLLGTADAIIP